MCFVCSLTWVDIFLVFVVFSVPAIVILSVMWFFALLTATDDKDSNLVYMEVPSIPAVALHSY